MENAKNKIKIHKIIKKLDTNKNKKKLRRLLLDKIYLTNIDDFIGS